MVLIRALGIGLGMIPQKVREVIIENLWVDHSQEGYVDHTGESYILYDGE